MPNNPNLKAVLTVFLRIAASRKFWVLLLSVLASYGLDLTPETQALILLVAGIVFAGTTAWEDVAVKRGGSEGGV